VLAVMTRAAGSGLPELTTVTAVTAVTAVISVVDRFAVVEMFSPELSG